MFQERTTIRLESLRKIPSDVLIHLSEEADVDSISFPIIAGRKDLPYGSYSSRTPSRCLYRFSNSLRNGSS